MKVIAATARYRVLYFWYNSINLHGLWAPVGVTYMLLVWLSILMSSCGLLWVLKHASKISVTDFFCLTLASYPVHMVGETGGLVSTVSACANYPIVTILQWTIKSLYYTASQQMSAVWKIPATSHALCRNWYVKNTALCLQELHLFMHCSKTLHWRMWMVQSFPLKFADHLKGADADCYCESNGGFDFNVSHMEHNYPCTVTSQ